VAVSPDNGLSWVVRTVPDGKGISPGSDPSVAAGRNNTVYLGYVNADGHAKITVSHDRGLHWSKSQDAGTPFGIQNAEFAEVIAGDDNRAAFAFLGTPTAGDTQSAKLLGIWHLYVAFTYNGGALGPPRTRHLPTPFSAAAFGTRAAATRAATCSTSTTSPWTSLDAYWWATPTAAPARA